MKSFILMYLFALSASAEVWEKPPYRPDENHLPTETEMIKEAQEERPEEKKEDPNFKVLDDEMKENEESSL